MKEKIIYCKASEVENDVQEYLDQGWKTKFVVAENVSTSVSISTSAPHRGDVRERDSTVRGYIVVVLVQ